MVVFANHSSCSESPPPQLDRDTHSHTLIPTSYGGGDAEVWGCDGGHSMEKQPLNTLARSTVKYWNFTIFPQLGEFKGSFWNLVIIV